MYVWCGPKTVQRRSYKFLSSDDQLILWRGGNSGQREAVPRKIEPSVYKIRERIGVQGQRTFLWRQVDYHMFNRNSFWRVIPPYRR